MPVMSARAKEPSSRGNGLVSLAEQATDIHKTGYLRKLKTMKKKFFVMRRESEAGPARLECYDSEKKWKAGALPKRTVVLRLCFNINRRADAKHRHVVTLHTRDDSFALVAESEEDLEAWLTELLRLQHGSHELDGDARPKPLFEHVWQVNVKPKGLGSSRNITGPHRLCLTAKALTLVKMHTDDEDPETLEFPLMSIRRCGHSDCFFFMELGRSSVTGSGELWMHSEDVVIAQNMHETILGAMKASRNREELGPLSRPRSSSTSENSKPITHKRPTHGATAIPSSSSSRDRSDSMPTSRSRNNSECHTEFRIGSFESASSTLSVDEPDGPPEYFNRYSHSLPVDIMAGPKEPTIKEEVAVDEYLMMSSPGTVSRGEACFLSRPTTLGTRTLDAPQQTTKTSDSNDYLKMSMSPSSSIPEGNADGYIPMSPVGSLSLSSSLERPSADLGYLPMEPQGQGGGAKQGSGATLGSSPTVVHVIPSSSAAMVGLSGVPQEYMDMAPLSSSLPKSVGESCTDFSGSWCSAHSLQDVPSSGSPLSTSLEGFHLDKVKSYFSPSEDDSESYIKPVRAYSIGSRQQVSSKKNHFSAHLDQSRVRAYSVGSQVAPAAIRRRRQKEHTDVELGMLRHMDSQIAKKSSSVPALPDGTTPRQTRADYNEDLMEINYDRSSSGSNSDITTVLPPKKEPAAVAAEAACKLSTAGNPGTAKSGNPSDKYYMLMCGPSDHSHEQMEFNFGRSSNSDVSTVPPLKEVVADPGEAARKLSTASSPGAVKSGNLPDDDYMLMSGGAEAGTSGAAAPNKNYLSFSFPRYDGTVVLNGGQRKSAVEPDAGKENCPKGRASFAGMSMARRDSASSTHVLKEENSTTASVSPTWPSNGMGSSGSKASSDYVPIGGKVKSDYVPIDVSGARGAAFARHSSNGAIPKSKALPLRPKSPEGQQLGEYVNLDLSKTWKWTQAVKPPVAASVIDPVGVVSGANGSWGSYPTPRAHSAPGCPLDVGAGCPAAQYVAPLDMTEGQPPPEANYENISLRSGAAAVVEAPAERVLNYASLDLAPPSGEEGSAGAVQRSPRATAVVDAAAEDGATFSYAEIDFTKSEGLRNVSGALREGRL